MYWIIEGGKVKIVVVGVIESAGIANSICGIGDESEFFDI